MVSKFLPWQFSPQLGGKAPSLWRIQAKPALEVRHTFGPKLAAMLAPD
jgi:hypothetical protein